MSNIFDVSEMPLPFYDMHGKENPTAGKNPIRLPARLADLIWSRIRKCIPHIALHRIDRVFAKNHKRKRE